MNIRSPLRSSACLAVLLVSGAAFASGEVSVTDAPAETNHTQFTMLNSYRENEGRFDPYGSYSSNPDSSSIWNWNTSFIFNYRFEKPWEIGVSFSGRDSSTDVPTGTSQSYSVGFPSIQTTYHTHFIGLQVMPQLSVATPWKFGSRSQTGDPSAYQDDSSASDGVFSAYSVRTGLVLMRRIPNTRFRLAGQGSYALPFNQRTESGSVTNRGHSFQLGEGVSYQVSSRWNTRLGVRQNWGAQTVLDGIYVDGSASRYFSSNVGVGYNATERMSLSAGFETAYPFYKYEANNSYSPTGSLAITYMGL